MHTQASSTAALDGLRFQTAQVASRKRTDNSWVVQLYLKPCACRRQCRHAARPAYLYGHILTIIQQSLPGSSVDGYEDSVLIECDWYEPVGTNPRTKLLQVRPCDYSNQFRFMHLRVFTHTYARWCFDIPHARMLFLRTWYARMSSCGHPLA